MKKLYFFFLLLPLWGLVGVAHASVTVQVLATNASNKTVTLRVEYANAVNDRVWVWIYLCSMQGMFQPAEISAASATSGSVAYTSTNTRGFFVTASPATITATLDNATGQFSCCAYGSDTPPNITLSSGTYTFKGTPPFTLIAADGTTTQTVTGNTVLASALTMTPIFLTDETGYPSNFCPYTGSDLYNVAAYLCWQRSSGAQNWEAWIKDTRDNELYRIVLMPDNKWWLAQNVKYASTGSQPTHCSADECGRWYSKTQASGTGGTGSGKQGICPNGWIFPILSDYTTLRNLISATASIVCQRLQSLDSQCPGGDDYYGWAGIKYTNHNMIDYGAAEERFVVNDASSTREFILNDRSGNTWQDCGYVCDDCGAKSQGSLRCFRQL